MTTDTGYPVSLLLEGPLFTDELETQPQHFRREHEIEPLRLVPSKSAASGVHTIYFRPEHRHWALVRLATRYRGLFEIQLHRGMSGEYQLQRQDFTPTDLEFLSDIIPQPPTEYSPVVYDMLWLVATYDEYLTLARAMVDRETFVPRDILQSMPDISLNDEGYFRRFLRSHLIRPKMKTTDNRRRGSNPEKAEISINRGTEYEVTDDGSEALHGIVTEHERIFEQQDFAPLLINPDLDPIEHLTEYEPEPTEPTPSVSLEEMEDETGILGEIAESFAPVEDELDSPTDSAESIEDSEETESVTAGSCKSQNGGPKTTTVMDGRSTRGSVSNAAGNDNQLSSESERHRDNRLSENGAAAHEDSPRFRSDSLDTDEQMVGEFTRIEVVDAAVTAATMIDEKNLVRTSTIKTTVWESIDLSERSRNDFWETVRDVLIAMDGIHGRTDGHIWASSEFE